MGSIMRTSDQPGVLLSQQKPSIPEGAVPLDLMEGAIILPEALENEAQSDRIGVKQTFLTGSPHLGCKMETSEEIKGP
jgi:hypothetical protein